MQNSNSLFTVNLIQIQEKIPYLHHHHHMILFTFETQHNDDRDCFTIILSNTYIFMFFVKCNYNIDWNYLVIIQIYIWINFSCYIMHIINISSSSSKKKLKITVQKNSNSPFESAQTLKFISKHNLCFLICIFYLYIN